MRPFYRDFSHPWVQSVTFQDVTGAELLEAVLAKGAPSESGKPKAWVFDVDSTLFCLGMRMRSIFRQFLREHEAPLDHWLRAEAFLLPEIQRYSFIDTFEHIFAQFDSAQAKERARELWKEFRGHWFEEFFSSRHSFYDVPYPCAPDFVKRVETTGYRVVYLTGRDNPGQRRGTLDSLKAHGFPRGPHTELVMKPSKHDDDVEFKRAALRDLKRRFDIVAAFDNEAVNLSMFAQELPDSEIVFFHSILSDRAPEGSYVQVLGGRKPWRMHHYC